MMRRRDPLNADDARRLERLVKELQQTAAALKLPYFIAITAPIEGRRGTLLAENIDVTRWGPDFAIEDPPKTFKKLLELTLVDAKGRITEPTRKEPTT